MTEATEQAPGVGHNSNGDGGPVASERLRSFIESIERLTEEKAALTADIREVFSEAKGVGFDVKIMRMILKVRAMDPEDRRQQAEMFDLYAKALGID